VQTAFLTTAWLFESLQISGSTLTYARGCLFVLPKKISISAYDQPTRAALAVAEDADRRPILPRRTSQILPPVVCAARSMRGARVLAVTISLVNAISRSITMGYFARISWTPAFRAGIVSRRCRKLHLRFRQAVFRLPQSWPGRAPVPHMEPRWPSNRTYSFRRAGWASADICYEARSEDCRLIRPRSRCWSNFENNSVLGVDVQVQARWQQAGLCWQAHLDTSSSTLYVFGELSQ